jgi:hypothetical protein
MDPISTAAPRRSIMSSQLSIGGAPRAPCQGQRTTDRPTRLGGAALRPGDALCTISAFISCSSPRPRRASRPWTATREPDRRWARRGPTPQSMRWAAGRDEADDGADEPQPQGCDKTLSPFPFGGLARFAEAEHHLRGALSRTRRKIVARIHQRVAFGFEHKSRCGYFTLDDFGINAVQRLRVARA